jgi:hypothetical protein
MFNSTLPWGLSRKERNTSRYIISALLRDWVISISILKVEIICAFKEVLHGCFLSRICLFVSCNSYACYPALLAKNMYWEEILLVHPIPKKPSYVQRVHNKFLCIVFQAIPSKFSCATFQKPSTTSCFVPLFLAHEDVVVGFVIFYTKLSTPRLACFICSSLILQGSWSDHCNLKKRK